MRAFLIPAVSCLVERSISLCLVMTPGLGIVSAIPVCDRYQRNVSKNW